MTLKVIGAGFGRTGTSSMKAALEQIGFGSCCHASDILFDDSKVRQWCQVVDGDDVNWDSIFEGYQSTVDWPASAFYVQQMNAFPQARVILTIRDPETWYRSTLETIYPISHLMAPRWLGALSGRIRRQRRLVFGAIWDGQMQGRFMDKDAAIRIFDEHIETVKQTVPGERLLVFDVREGWGPLCEFLGVAEIPDTPFPHVNESAELKRIVRQLRWRWRTFYLLAGAALAATIGFALLS